MLDKIFSFSLAEVAASLSFVTVAAAAWGVCLKIYNWAKKPNEKQNEKLEEQAKEIAAIKKKLEEHDKFFANDKQIINAMQEENHLVMESLFALLQHGIDGNNIEPMRKAQKNIQDYLINK